VKRKAGRGKQGRETGEGKLGREKPERRN